MSRTNENIIKTVYGSGRHVVILGAGPRIASIFINTESTGNRLPTMDNFIDLVGLTDIVESLSQRLKAKNFE